MTLSMMSTLLHRFRASSVLRIPDSSIYVCTVFSLPFRDGVKISGLLSPPLGLFLPGSELSLSSHFSNNLIVEIIMSVL